CCQILCRRIACGWKHHPEMLVRVVPSKHTCQRTHLAKFGSTRSPDSVGIATCPLGAHQGDPVEWNHSRTLSRIDFHEDHCRTRELRFTYQRSRLLVAQSTRQLRQACGRADHFRSQPCRAKLVVVRMLGVHDAEIERTTNPAILAHRTTDRLCVLPRPSQERPVVLRLRMNRGRDERGKESRVPNPAERRHVYRDRLRIATSSFPPIAVFEMVMPTSS